MTYTTEFYNGPDWQQSSSPSLPRKWHLEDNDDTAIIWPVGSPHDDLADGLHPVVALGPKANRPRNVTGVVMAYNSDTEIATVDVADKKIVKAYVVNVSGYSDTDTPNAWINTVQPGDPVFVDDTADIGGAYDGVTLSFSAANDAGSDNPLAGYVIWCQDEYADSGVGGPNTTQGLDQPASDDTTEVLTLCVMLVNDCGYAA